MPIWGYNQMLKAIRSLPKPEKSMILMCRVDTLGNAQERIYRIRRIEPVWRYASSISGGQLHFTDKHEGLNGEEVEPSPFHWIVESDVKGEWGYIDHFRAWGWVLSWLKMMRARELEFQNE